MIGEWRVFWDTKAKESLKDIFRFLRSKASPEVATKVRNKIIGEVKSIIPFSYQGAIEPNLSELDEDFRFKLVWNYKIIYEVRNKDVFVLDIFHTSRNPSAIKRG